MPSTGPRSVTASLPQSAASCSPEAAQRFFPAFRGFVTHQQIAMERVRALQTVAPGRFSVTQAYPAGSPWAFTRTNHQPPSFPIKEESRVAGAIWPHLALPPKDHTHLHWHAHPEWSGFKPLRGNSGLPSLQTARLHHKGFQLQSCRPYQLS